MLYRVSTVCFFCSARADTDIPVQAGEFEFDSQVLCSWGQTPSIIISPVFHRNKINTSSSVFMCKSFKTVLFPISCSRSLHVRRARSPDICLMTSPECVIVNVIAQDRVIVSRDQFSHVVLGVHRSTWSVETS